jgi:hypothetical protein
MKRKIVAMLAIVAVFGLAIAAYAYTTSNTGAAKASCCSKSDSCPMKAKGHEHQSAHGSESCPMKNGAGDTAAADGHSCCDCCGDSCPMTKSGEAKAGAAFSEAGAASSEEGKSCCDNCDC